MLVAPDVKEPTIIAFLESEYAVVAESVTFLPVGADVDSAAYRVATTDGNRFFLKLRSGSFRHASVTVPHHLASRGARWLIAPLPTRSAALSTGIARFTAVLYPFVDGSPGWNINLSPEQWAQLGAGLRALHDAEIPPRLLDGVPRESYSPVWRDDLERRLAHLPECGAGDPIARSLVQLIEQHRPTVEHLLERAESLASVLSGRSTVRTTCHGDIHAGNILVDSDGRVCVVDWDTMIIAPKERDLMFIGGGVGGTWNTQGEIDRFMDGYGSVEIDAIALVYYRYERIVEDIAVVCSAVFDTHAARSDRAVMVRQIAEQFSPGNVVEIARRTDREMLL